MATGTPDASCEPAGRRMRRACRATAASTAFSSQCDQRLTLLICSLSTALPTECGDNSRHLLLSKAEVAAAAMNGGRQAAGIANRSLALTRAFAALAALSAAQTLHEVTIWRLGVK